MATPWQQRKSERGIALVMAIAVLAVLTLTGTTIVYYTSSGSREAAYSASAVSAEALAEAGIAHALAILSNSSTPMSPSLLSPRTLTLGAGTATFSGTLSGSRWTITSTGVIKNPTGATNDVSRTLTRLADVYGINVGATVSDWNRFYSDDTTQTCGATVRRSTIPGPLTARGNLCIRGTGRVSGSPLSVGGNVTLEQQSRVGSNGQPITQADIAGTCRWNGGTPHSPCGSADRVYAQTITTAPQNLVKPTVDHSYWYDNAMPGPRHNCTTGSFPGGFDNNTTYDRSLPTVELTPTGSSYTCQVRDAGNNLVGELSWNHVTHVLTVKGTISIDGSVTLNNSAQLVNYLGQATLYLSGTWFSREVVCAGGNGLWNCRAAGQMANWDPATNMLVVIGGGLTSAGSDDVNMHNNSAFQGVLYSVHDCRLDNNLHLSGPAICNELFLGRGGGGTPSFFAWWTPPSTLLTGQIYRSPYTATIFEIVAGAQYG